MISHAHRCIFIHIPKCAGTSIEAALGHHQHYDGRGRQDHRNLARIQPWSIGTALYPASITATYKNVIALRHKNPNPANRYKVNAAQYDSYYRFSIVRNPWTRCISWFKNVSRDQLHQSELGLEGASFRDSLMRQIGKGMLRPQTFWLRNRAGKIDLDFIGRFETIADDFRRVCDEIGVEDVELPKLLKSPSGPAPSEYFDNETDRLIRTVFAEEIEIFSYAFPD